MLKETVALREDPKAMLVEDCKEDLAALSGSGAVTVMALLEDQVAQGEDNHPEDMDLEVSADLTTLVDQAVLEDQVVSVDLAVLVIQEILEVMVALEDIVILDIQEVEPW